MQQSIDQLARVDGTSSLDFFLKNHSFKSVAPFYIILVVLDSILNYLSGGINFTNYKIC
jgi:hypothetical protein